MIYAKNGNLFGPRTPSVLVDDLLETPLYFFAAHFKCVYVVSSIEGDKVFFADGRSFTRAAVMEINPILVHENGQRLFLNGPIEDDIPHHFILTNDYDGSLLIGQEIATDYPVLFESLEKERIYDTTALRVETGLHGDGDYVIRTNHGLFFTFENAILYDPSRPLQKNNAPILPSCTPSGPGDDPFNNLGRTKIRIIEDTVMYLCNPWSSNYNVFLHEYCPASFFGENYVNNLKYYIANIEWQRELMELMGVPSEHIIKDDNETAVVFRRVIIPLRFSNLSYIGKQLVDTYKKLRQTLREAAKPVEAKTGNLFLGRRQMMGNTGNNRFMTNADQVLDLIRDFGVKPVYAEDCPHIPQKYAQLSHADLIITEIGANVCNICLSESPKAIILIASPGWWIIKYYWKYLMQTIHPNARVILFEDCSVEDNHQSDDTFNKPFRVNVETLRGVLTSVIFGQT
ncbi:glycosyltransferase 61 family protein [Methylobacterium organophilum]|uniref:Glycosyltransferase 61 catalytic domain-containing protein n=1 Tax=Methylobacterium organophilum TaxID=410 RepID=A0ABQ4TDJ2_METOR|nr:glycosyltransferase 61 family protein [Methylobacterium organophilum]GJE28584.1 hypothetical protein LKMONMHP_3456 [Methylobacterium organophilum]